MTARAGAPTRMVSTAELRAVLEDGLSRHFGAQRSVARLERRPSAYSSSVAIEELDVCLDDGTTLQLMFKDLSGWALLEAGRRARPAFLYDPLREIETYRVLLAPQGLGTATCYGTVVDERVGRYWLFLERVPGVELYQVGELATWQQVARWLAAMHDRFAEKVEPLAQAQATHLLNLDGSFYRMWLPRAQAFLQRAEAARAGRVRRGMQWLADRYDRVVERLVTLPVTVIHGEFYASNILVQELPGNLRVCPVDWELAGVGAGLIDLAALTGGRWTQGQRAALALAYRAALAPRRGWPPAPDAFLAALDCCHLHLAVRWLGWSPDWSPPPEHAQNWLSEALCLVEKLGL